MKVLIFGSSGMLGKSLVLEAQKRSYTVLGVDITKPDNPVDITKEKEVERVFWSFLPEVVINTVAAVDLLACENDPCMAYRVNCRPASYLSEYCKQLGVPYIHISTDHFFCNDGRKKHAEDANVILPNEYSRTKYLGERLAILYSKSLVVRTNIVGFKGDNKKPTFIEWFLRELLNGKSIKLFVDYFTSSIDVKSFSTYLFELIEIGATGLLNLASSTVSSKKEFIEMTASRLGLSLNDSKPDSVFSIPGIRRAESLGLDVSKAEAILARSMPSLEEVVDNIAVEAHDWFQI